MIVIDKSKCVGCGKCVEACPTHAIYMVGKEVFVRDELCRSCGACVEVCPKEAIAMSSPAFQGINRSGYRRPQPMYSLGFRSFRHQGWGRHRFGRRRW